MLTTFSKKNFLNIFNQNNPTKKILLTLVILFIFRFGNTIPLSGIDQDALKKSFLQLENANNKSTNYWKIPYKVYIASVLPFRNDSFQKFPIPIFFRGKSTSMISVSEK